MRGWRSRAVSLGLTTIRATGLDRALRPLARGPGVILMLHSVRPERGLRFRQNAALEVTPAFLATVLDVLAEEGFVFVPLDEVPERLDRGEGAPPFAAVTFDDGYRDNRDYALPVLLERGVPWTVFVTTAFAEGDGRLWWVELERAVAGLDEIRLPGPEGERVLPAGTVREKERAFAVLHARARASGRASLLHDMDRLCDAAGLDPRAILREHCLDWAEIAALSRRPGVQIGAHAVTHHALARLPSEEAHREIAGGRRILQERLGLRIDHLAYPFGDAGAAGPREFALAQSAGFRTAVTTRRGPVSVRQAGGIHALPRLSVNGHFQTEAAIRTLSTGVPFLLESPSRIAAAARGLARPARSGLPAAVGRLPRE